MKGRGSLGIANALLWIKNKNNKENSESLKQSYKNLLVFRRNI
jgi:hypothetical protein